MKRCLLAITGADSTSGGIAAVNRLVSQALIDFGFELETFSLSEVAFPENQHRYHCFGGNKYKFTWAVWSALSSTKYDLVIVDHINLASILIPLKLLKRCQYLVWLFGFEVFPPRPDFQGYLGMRGAQRCIAISPYTFQQIISRYPNLDVVTCELCLEPHKLPVNQPDFVNQKAFQLSFYSVDGVERRINDQLILHVGRMVAGTRNKGQAVLLDAFPIVSRHFPQAQLMLVGQGEQYDHLIGAARGLSDELQSRIFFPGFVTDELLKKLYRYCYLFAMPSSGEGFGLVYLEAMAHAKPCIGANCGATPNLVRDGVTGGLVNDPKSAVEVAEKIMILLADPHKAQKLGQSGRELANANYLFPHFKARLARALEIPE